MLCKLLIGNNAILPDLPYDLLWHHAYVFVHTFGRSLSQVIVWKQTNGINAVRKHILEICKLPNGERCEDENELWQQTVASIRIKNWQGTLTIYRPAAKEIAKTALLGKSHVSTVP